MCKCTPEIRTPWWGKPGCEAPSQQHPPAKEKLQMNGRDWTDLAGIQGELEGLAQGVTMAKPDINFEGLISALKELSEKVKKIRENHKPVF